MTERAAVLFSDGLGKKQNLGPSMPHSFIYLLLGLSSAQVLHISCY